MTGQPRGSLMLVLDAGAFLAVERGDREVMALVKRERLAGRVPVTSGEWSLRGGVTGSDGRRRSPGC
jgi:hypothetical protein